MATRSETVKLRLTVPELELYKSRAGAFGMTLSDWIRARCGDTPAEQEKRAEQTTIAAAGLELDAATGKIVYEAPRSDRKVYPSEKLRSVKRTGLCPHRRRPDEYCSQCD